MTIAATAALAGNWTIDAAHSRVGFMARHAMVTKVRGAFNEFDGSAVVDADDFSRSRASVVIQAASIDTRNAQRDEHLRGNEFFDMGAFPQIVFVSTAVTPTGPESFDLTGDLTIKDVTRSVTVPFSFEGVAAEPVGNQRAGFEGSVAISRKDYGVTWNAALETGGVLVSDKIVLEFDVSAIKNA